MSTLQEIQYDPITNKLEFVKLPFDTGVYPDSCVLAMSEDDEPCEVDEDDGVVLDSITYAPIEPKNLVRIRCNRDLRCFDINTLMKLLEKENPSDPYTRQPFTKEFQDDVRKLYFKMTGKIDVSKELVMIDKLFEAGVSTLEFSQTIPPNVKANFQEEIRKRKKNFKSALEKTDAVTFVQVKRFLFGTETERGAAVEIAEQINLRIINAEF